MNRRAAFASIGCLVAICSAIALAQESREPASNVVLVQMQTTQGLIELELDPVRAPISVQNFVNYARRGHYDGTVFHRVIDGFMIQGGGLDRSLKEQKTGAPIKNEALNGLKNDKYTIAMARSPEPDSATSQFFINVGNNGFLNRDQCPDGHGYAVFGRVVKGQNVVEKISKAETGAVADPNHVGNQLEDVPKEPILIQRVVIR